MSFTKNHFQIVGFLSSNEFQKCRYYAEKLFDFFPNQFKKPIIRSMLNVDWDEYLTRTQRELGSETWNFRTVIVFLNNEILGNEKDLVKFVSKNYVVRFNVDYNILGCQQLVDYINKQTNVYQRQFIYLTIASNYRVIGSMLFLLYNDLVPLTCANFVDCLKEKSKVEIHRVAKNGWLQFKGLKFIPPYVSHENYVVPHDRRGILSLCKQRRHSETQFFVTLQPSSWMDCKFVAFGQLVQGVEILKKLELARTYHQKPLQLIEIVDIGEFTLPTDVTDNLKHLCIEKYDSDEDEEFHDVDTLLSASRYYMGKYCLATDLRSYDFFLEPSLPAYLFEKYKGEQGA